MTPRTYHFYIPNAAFLLSLDIGLEAGIEGNSYHGSPGKYGVKDPQLQYSIAKGGPSVTLNLLPWLHVKLAGGYTFYRNLEFYDGRFTVASFDLDQTGYFSVNLSIGE